MSDQIRNQLNRIEATLNLVAARLKALEDEFREFRKVFRDLEITVDAVQLFHEGIEKTEQPPDIDWDRLLATKPPGGDDTQK